MKSLRHTLRSLPSIFILIPLCLQAQSAYTVTYISNEGFLLEHEGIKVLMDGLFDHIDEDWCDSPSLEMLELMSRAEPPFDRIDLITISHEHRDHFSAKLVLEHMQSNPGVKVVCPNQVFIRLAEHPEFHTVQHRVLAITPAVLKDSTVTLSSLDIRVVRLEHSPYMEVDSETGKSENRHANIENLGFIISHGDLTFFHCGDTNPLNRAEYRSYSLHEAALDLAFLERMFLSQGAAGIDAMEELINPDQTIFMHIRPSNIPVFSDFVSTRSDMLIFEHPLDRHVFKRLD